MAIPVLSAVTSVARRAVQCRTGGIWHAITSGIEGRNAVNFERERRVTLLSVPQALPSGTEFYDQRADGGSLVLRLPATPCVEVILVGNIPVIRPPTQSLATGGPVTTSPEEGERV